MVLRATQLAATMAQMAAVGISVEVSATASRCYCSLRSTTGCCRGTLDDGWWARVVGCQIGFANGQGFMADDNDGR